MTFSTLLSTRLLTTSRLEAALLNSSQRLSSEPVSPMASRQWPVLTP